MIKGEKRGKVRSGERGKVRDGDKSGNIGKGLMVG